MTGVFFRGNGLWGGYVGAVTARPARAPMPFVGARARRQHHRHAGAVIGDGPPPREDPRRWLPMRAAMEAPQQQTGTVELAIPDLEQAMVTGKLRHMRRALSKKYKLTRSGERRVMHNAFQSQLGVNHVSAFESGQAADRARFSRVFFPQQRRTRIPSQSLHRTTQVITTSSQSRPLTAHIVGLLCPGGTTAECPPTAAVGSLTDATGFAPFSGNPAEEARCWSNSGIIGGAFTAGARTRDPANSFTIDTQIFTIKQDGWIAFFC